MSGMAQSAKDMDYSPRVVEEALQILGHEPRDLVDLVEVIAALDEFPIELCANRPLTGEGLANAAAAVPTGQAAHGSLTLHGQRLAACIASSSEARNVVAKLLINILQNPDKEEFRAFHTGSKTFRAAVGNVPEVLEFIRLAGFMLPDSDQAGEASMAVVCAESDDSLKHAYELLRDAAAAEIFKRSLPDEGSRILHFPMAPKCTKFGTKEEPCYHFENVYEEPPHRRGKTVAEAIAWSFGKMPLPTPSGADKLRSWSHSWPANGKALRPKARELLRYLRDHCRDDWHVDREPDRDFHCGNFSIHGENGSHFWHQDHGVYGRLLFLFVAGNSSENVIRLRGKHSKDEKVIIMQSGDCLVFEGQTWHAVRKIYPKTSPFTDKSEWLHNRRLSVLVRQNAPKVQMRRPHYLKK